MEIFFCQAYIPEKTLISDGFKIEHNVSDYYSLCYGEDKAPATFAAGSFSELHLTAIGNCFETNGINVIRRLYDLYGDSAEFGLLTVCDVNEILGGGLTIEKEDEFYKQADGRIRKRIFESNETEG